MDERKREGEEGLRRGSGVSCAARWALFVLNVSLLGFRRHTAFAKAEAPSPDHSPTL